MKGVIELTGIDQIINQADGLLDGSESDAMLDEPSEESQNGWNIIPYGKPSNCKKRLLVILDSHHDLSSLFERAINHINLNCKGITNLVYFYVDVDMNLWSTEWFKYERAFTQLEARGIDVRISFKNK